MTEMAKKTVSELCVLHEDYPSFIIRKHSSQPFSDCALSHWKSMQMS